MQKFTYADLVDRWDDEILAGWCLTEIEKAAGIKPQIASIDLEARLAHALSLQDNIAQRRMAA
jgi:hypothetical protein